MATRAELQLELHNSQFLLGLAATDKAVSRSIKSMDLLTLATSNISKAAIGLAAFAVAAKAISLAIPIYAKFEQQMADLSAITGATGKDLLFFADAAREMGKATRFSATQAAEAFKLVASAKPDLLENAAALQLVTQQTLTLAAAAGVDLSSAAKIVGQSLNQFGASADQAARFVNVLAAGAKFGASEVLDTGKAVTFAGNVAKEAGSSFEEFNAAIQVLAFNGIKATRAGRGLRQVYARLVSQTDEKINPSVVGLGNALLELQNRQLSLNQVFADFGLVAAPAALALIKNAEQLIATDKAAQGTGDSMQTLLDKLTDTNVAAEQAQIQMDTLTGDFLRMKSVLEELAIGFVGVFGPDLRSGLEFAIILIKALGVALGIVGVAWLAAKLVVQTFFLAIGTGVLGSVKAIAQLLNAIGLVRDETAKAATEFADRFTETAFVEMKKTTDQMGRLITELGRTEEESIAAANAAKELSSRLTKLTDDEKAAIKAAQDQEKALKGLTSGLIKEVAILKIRDDHFGRSKRFVDALVKAEKDQTTVTNAVAKALELASKQAEAYERSISDKVAIESFIESVEDQAEALIFAEVAAGKTAVQLEAMGLIVRTQTDSASELGKKIIDLANSLSAAQKEAARKKAFVDFTADIKRQTLALETEIATLNETGLGFEATNRIIKQSGAVTSEETEIVLDLVAALNKLQEELRGANEARQTRDTIKGLREELNLAQQMVGVFGDQELARLQILAIQDLGMNATQGEIDLVRQLVAETLELERQTEKVNEAWGIVQTGLERLFDDLIDNGKFQFKEFFLFIVKEWLKTQAAIAASKLVFNLQSAASGDGFFGGGGSGGGNFSSALSAIKGIKGLFGGAATQGAVTSSSIASAHSAGAAAAQSAFGGGTSAVGGTGAAGTTGFTSAQLSGIGAAAFAIAAAYAVDILSDGGLFGTSTERTGNARLQLSGGSVTGSVTRETSRERSLFRGTESTRTETPLSHQTLALLNDQLDILTQSIGSAAVEITDLTAEGFADFLQNFDLATNFNIDFGATEEEIQGLLQGSIQNLTNNLANQLVPALELVREPGEKAAEVLVGLGDVMRVLERGVGGFELDDLISDDFLAATAERMKEAIIGSAQASGPQTTTPAFEAWLDSLTDFTQDTEDAVLDSTEVLNAARIIYLDALDTAAGGAERLSELIGIYAATFTTSQEQVENVLGAAVASAQSNAERLLNIAGTTRETFVQDFTDAQLQGIDPETFVQFLEASEALAQLFELEVQLASARGEALQVASLTADQMQVLEANTNELLRSFEAFGDGLGLASGDVLQFTLNLSAAVGSLEAVQEGLGFIFDRFLSDTQQLEFTLSSAAAEIEGMGLNVADFAVNGRQHFLDLFNAAVELGDDDLIATLIKIAPAIDAWISANEALTDSLEDSGAAAGDATATFVDLGNGIDGAGDAADLANPRFAALGDAIQSAMANVQSAIARVLSSGASVAGVGNINTRISSARGRLGSGSLESQIETVNELTGLITTRYDTELGEIQRLMDIESQANQAANDRAQARFDEAQRLYQEEVRLFNQRLAAVTTLQDFLTSLETGRLSGNTIAEETVATREAFMAALTSGDAALIQSTAQAYLEAAQLQFGSSEAFFDIRDQVISAIERVIETLDPGLAPAPPTPPELITTAVNTQRMADLQAQAAQLQRDTIAELEELAVVLEELEVQRVEAEQAWRDEMIGNGGEAVVIMSNMNDGVTMMNGQLLADSEIISQQFALIGNIHVEMVSMNAHALAGLGSLANLEGYGAQTVSAISGMSSTLRDAYQNSTAILADRMEAKLDELGDRIESAVSTAVASREEPFDPDDDPIRDDRRDPFLERA